MSAASTWLSKPSRRGWWPAVPDGARGGAGPPCGSRGDVMRLRLEVLPWGSQPPPDAEMLDPVPGADSKDFGARKYIV